MIDATNIETARQRLRFVGRTLANGYLDLDTVDELARAVALALSDLAEPKNEPTPDQPGELWRVTVHEQIRA